MAAGDIKWFAQALHDLGNKIHDLDADVLKVGLVTSVTAPAIGTAAPHWGGTGTTNFATTEVTPGGNYAAGGPTLAAVTWSIVANVPTLRATDPVILQHAANPTNVRWGIVYNSTDVNKRAIAFIDLGSDRNLTTGDFTINFGGAGTDVLTLTQS